MVRCSLARGNETELEWPRRRDAVATSWRSRPRARNLLLMTEARALIRPRPATSPAQVVIAGGGVAGLEAMLALRDLAGDRVSITLVAPQPAYTDNAMAVPEVFARGHVRHYELAAVANSLSAEFVRGSVNGVDPDAGRIHCASGATIDYDHLVLAVGAKARPAWSHGITFGEDPSRGGASRPAPGDRTGVRRPGRVHRPRRHRVAGPALRAGPHDRPSRVEHGHGAGPLHARHSRGAAARGIRPRAERSRRRSCSTTTASSSSARPTRASSTATCSSTPAGAGSARARVISLPVLDGPDLPGVPADPSGFILDRPARPRARPGRRLRGW